MTFFGAIGWSLLRSLAVMTAGLWLAVQIVRWLQSLSKRRRGLGWGAVLIPFFTPTLMVGYCYRDTSLSLMTSPVLKETVYGLLVLSQAVPVAVLLLWFAPPPPVTPAAMHSFRLFRPRQTSLISLRWQQASAALLPAAAILFLIAFQEADLAALMQTAGWPEWLFTRHAGGLPIFESMQYAVMAMVLQLPWMIPIVSWTASTLSDADTSARPRSITKKIPLIAVGWIVIALVIVSLLPMWQLWRGARQGWPALLQQPSTYRELFDAALLAVTSGGIAVGVSLALVARKSRAWTRPCRFLLPFALICGLVGNLTLGILLAAFFQTRLLLWAYDTPIPLIVGEASYILPRVLLLVCCVSRLSTGSSRHAIGLLQRSSDPRQRTVAKRIQWQVNGRGWAAVGLVACFWVYLEPMLCSLLAMPGLEPVGWVLYNSLHYGAISAMAAKLVLAIVLPLLAAVIMLAVHRIRLRLR